MEHAPSAQQQSIFDWFATGAGNLVVQARAGTGKTTTILAAVRRAPEKRIMLCAFNKLIADELTARVADLRPRVEAKTLHSLGFECLKRAWRGVRVDNDRGARLARDAAGAAADRKAVTVIARIASRAKGALPHPESLPQMVNFVLDAEIETEGFDVEWLADRAYAAMQFAQEQDGTCDFDDMVYLPVVLGLTKPTYNLIVVDECQDMNASQIQLALMLAAGRVAVVGDDRQAIYGFRGADSGSLARLTAELSATTLPLNITYRCPRLVVAEAARLVPDYQAAPNAPEGTLESVSEPWFMSAVAANDFVLSRANAPLVRVCLALIRSGRRARIQGRDIAATLKALVFKIGGNDRSVSVADFVEALGRWHERESATASRIEGDRGTRRGQLIEDQYETLLALTDGVADVGGLFGRLDTIFAEDAHADRDYVVLSSVHKAKGLERDRVWLLEESFKRQGGEEDNIRYVALTRAKRDLRLVQRSMVA